jgi:hypothetical protein
MTNRAIVTLVALALVASGAAVAAERTFVVKPGDHQRVEYIDGQKVLFADGVSASVAVTYLPGDSKRGWVAVTVRNVSPEAFVVEERSLSASSGEKPLTVFTHDQLMKEQKRREAWNAVAAGLAAAGNSMNAANAGNSYSYGTYRGQTNASAYGSGGYAYGTANTTGTYSGYTYDPSKAAAAQASANAQNQQMIDRMQAQHQQQRAAISERTLRANTVSPGEYISGQILIQLPKRSRKNPAEISMVLAVGMDEVPVTLQEVQD